MRPLHFPEFEALSIKYCSYRLQVQGGAIDKVAKKTIKVLVVGNPANTNAVIW